MDWFRAGRRLLSLMPAAALSWVAVAEDLPTARAPVTRASIAANRLQVPDTVAPLPGPENQPLREAKEILTTKFPAIINPEFQPIDLNTALQVAGVQNPELLIARQRVVE